MPGIMGGIIPPIGIILQKTIKTKGVTAVTVKMNHTKAFWWLTQLDECLSKLSAFYFSFKIILTLNGKFEKVLGQIIANDRVLTLVAFHA